MKKLRTFVKDVLASVAKNIILIGLSMLWTLLVTNLGLLFDKLRGAGLALAAVYCILAALAAAVVVLSVLLIRVYARRYKSFDFKFKLEKLVVELEFVTRERIFYKLKFHLRATDRVDVFKSKLVWTGNNMSGDPEFTYNPGCDVIESCGGDSEYDRFEKYFNVRFLPPLYKGGENRFHIQYECRDDAHVMSPHLAYKIKWPTKRLVMRVVSRENLLSNVRYCVYAESNDELPLEDILPAQARVENSYYVYEWDVKHPHQFFYYRFDWLFKQANPSK